MKTFKMKLHLKKFPYGSNREKIYYPFKENKKVDLGNNSLINFP